MVALIALKKMLACLIDITDPPDLHKRQYYWMRTIKIIAPLTPKEHTKQYLQLHAFHQSYKFILLPKVCKSNYVAVTLLLLFYFFVS